MLTSLTTFSTSFLSGDAYSLSSVFVVSWFLSGCSFRSVPITPEKNWELARMKNITQQTLVIWKLAGN